LSRSYASASDVYLIKTNNTGDETWSKTFGGIYAEKGNSIQQTGDGGFIIAGQTFSYGSGSPDVYLIKTDGMGNETWSKSLGGNNYEKSFSVQQTKDGGYIITGLTASNGTGYGDVLLIKTDTYGNVYQ